MKSIKYKITAIHNILRCLTDVLPLIMLIDNKWFKKKEINSIKKYDIKSKIRYFRTVWEFSKKLNSIIQNANDLGNIFTNKIHIDI